MVRKAEETETKRTEDEKVAQAPIEVILGGKKYKIAPLVIRDSREWRKKYFEVTAPLFDLVDATINNAEEYSNLLEQIFVIEPNQVIDLFFAYAKDLNREEIEGNTTEAEINMAFKEVVKVALPLSRSLPQAIGRLSP